MSGVEDGRLPFGDRATRASTEPASSLGHSAGIADALAAAQPYVAEMAEIYRQRWETVFADKEQYFVRPYALREADEAKAVLELVDAALAHHAAQAGVTRMGRDGATGSVGEADSTRSEGCAQTTNPKDTSNGK